MKKIKNQLSGHFSLQETIGATESKTPTQNIDRDFKRKIDFLRKKLKLTKAALALAPTQSPIFLPFSNFQ